MFKTIFKLTVSRNLPQHLFYIPDTSVYDLYTSTHPFPRFSDMFTAVHHITVVLMCSVQLCVILVVVFGLVIYRISIKTALHMSSASPFRSNIRATVKTTAAIINLIIIIIMDEVYGAVARWLTTMGEDEKCFGGGVVQY